jgi:hypothetical protein
MPAIPFAQFSKEKLHSHRHFITLCNSLKESRAVRWRKLMDLFKDYYDIGKNSASGKFLSELKKAKSYYLDTQNKNKELIDGALLAFYQGRPENIQTALSNAKDINDRHHPNLVPAVLCEITKNSSDKIHAVNLALAKVPAQDRQDILNQALNEALAHNVGGETFFVALLNAGAEAKADINGAAGLLATAVSAAAPLSFIKLLHDSGASFEDALATLHSRGSKTEDIDRLEYYKKQIAAGADETATCSPHMELGMVRVLETLQQIQEQIADLTSQVGRLSERVNDLTPPKPAANENQPEAAKSPQKTPGRVIPRIA